MKSAEVQQLGPLSDLFAEALTFCRPASIAIVGIAGGNGLDHVNGHITQRVVGLDVNPLYLDAVRRRYSMVRGLELYCIDLAEQLVHCSPCSWFTQPWCSNTQESVAAWTTPYLS